VGTRRRQELTVIDWFKVSSASKIGTKRSVSNIQMKGKLVLKDSKARK